MKRILASALLVLAGFMAVPVQADVPLRINYQGRVTDSTGALIGAGTPVNRKIIFRIWDHASNSTGRLWTEEQTVTIYNGDFSVLLGAGIDPTGTAASESRPALDTVFAAGGTDRFLEIMVDDGNNTIEAGDQPISPRQQITSTGYAFRAKFADNVATGTDLNLNGSDNYGLGWYGTGRQFANTSIDGPVLYGNAGGALGSYNGTTQTSALRWNAAGQVGVGSVDLAGMDATSKMVIQGNEAGAPPKQLTIRGGTDTNKRLYVGYNTSSNYGALQAYNGTSTTTNLLLNPLGGNVGLGSSTPGFPLTFSDILGDKISLNGQSGNSYGFGIQSSRLQIHTDGVGSDILFGYGSSAALTETMRIKGNGNVGIGTVGPNEKLEVAGNVRINPGRLTLYNNSGNGSTMTMQAGLLSNEIHGNSGPGTDAGQLRLSAGGETNVANKTAIDLYGFDTNDMRFFTNGTERMRLASGGNVGIGTMGPLGRLTVKGKFTNNLLDVDSGIRFEEEDNTTAWNQFYDTTNDNLAFRYAGAGSDTLSLKSNGKVGIGTAYPAETLDVNGSASLGGAATANHFFISGNQIQQLNNTTAAPMHLNLGGGNVTLVGSGTGNVGIGTSSPTKGKLEITGTAGNTTSSNAFRTYEATTINIFPAGSNVFGSSSIYASGRIIANDFLAFSDQRIKKVQGFSNATEDLATLLNIKITDFGYIDTVAHGTGQQKKIIAQQVEEVFPQAVSRSTDVVPDIYQVAAVKNGWIILPTDLKRGDRVRLVGEQHEGVHEVLEVAEGRFRTDLESAGDKVFVYGREVNDFRQVDYEAISMLNVSATQELARKLDAKDAEVKALKAKVAELTAVQKRLAELEAKDKAREAKLIAIEKLLLSADKPAVRTASLKQGGGAE